MEAWLRSNGGRLDSSLSIAHSAAAGLHWRANAPIPAGTSLITVPHSLALSYLNALVDDAYPIFRNQRHRLKIENIGFFYLMVQYVNREQSFWRPYLDSLPKPESDFCTPLWFREQDDLEWVVGTDVLHTAKGRLEIYKQYHATGVEVLREAGIDPSPYTWDLFLWAVTMFTSRSFSSNAIRPQDSKYWTTYKQSLEGGRRQAVLLDMSHTPAEDLDFSVLFPVLDAGNHRLEAKVDWTFDPGRFTVTSLEEYAAGQEVYNNYGAWKGNSELFMGYGFCIPGNPNETVMLTLKPPPPDLQASLRIFHPGYFHPDGTWAGEKATFHIKAPIAPLPAASSEAQILTTLPEPLLEILLYMLMHERNVPITFIERPHAFLVSSITESHHGGGSQYQPFVARALVQSLAPKLAQLETAPLPSRPSNLRQATAAIYRSGQLDILRSTIAALKTIPRSLLHKPFSIPGHRLLTLDTLLVFFTSTSPNPDQNPSTPFLTGMAASAGTNDPTLLRAAGWEQDLLVLLLCYIYLHSAPSWLPAFPSTSLNPDHERETEGPAQDLLTIVHTAAAQSSNHDGSGVSSDSTWTDPRWSAAFITRYGGEMLRTRSFGYESSCRFDY
nr:ribosomal lysine n-methyltransferase set10 [Quercus suber]